MSNGTPIVGIIANPAAGKDIRRLVAHGRFVPNQEKVNILRRVLAGLESAGVRRVVFMPDMDGIARASIDHGQKSLDASFVDIPLTAKEIDSTRASEAMRDMGAGCIVTLGGDGTNRACAKGSGQVPLMPISTGTNNVFPQMVEGTVAGIAAGVVASGAVDAEAVTRASPALDVRVDGAARDIALVDAAVSAHEFIGARALWDLAAVSEVFLSRTDADAIGLSAIGARLMPQAADGSSACRVKLGEGGMTVDAPIGPGMIRTVPIAAWEAMRPGEPVCVERTPCTIALDGERTFAVRKGESAQVVLREDGPPVVDAAAAIREATRLGVFLGAGSG